uniref:Uncharacterized protein n=1 Tax=Timema bartmani TaxID=61472 RepID=A0A7R9I8J2_9NEOP|nr:unnamed protein product [Timema bartmani]
MRLCSIYIKLSNRVPSSSNSCLSARPQRSAVCGWFRYLPPGGGLVARLSCWTPAVTRGNG